MDARGTGQALFDAAAALSESRGTQHQPANALLRHSSQRSPERWGKRSCSTSETEFSSLGPDVEQPLASLPAP
ncbi:Protein of unknown function [Gryllus bimaculatus]|nr:Protein of unknown function [Gryllus bimaculatus]